MISIQKDKATITPSVIIVSRDYQNLTIIASTEAQGILKASSPAPEANYIVVADRTFDAERFDNLNFDAMLQDLVRFHFKDTSNQTSYNKVKASQLIQARFTNAKFGVPEVYGIKTYGKLLGFDYGFQLVLDDNHTVYLDFGLIGKTKLGLRAYGYDCKLKQCISCYDRSWSYISDNKYFIIKGQPDALLRELLPEVTSDDILLLPNLSLAVTNAYSDLQDGVFQMLSLSSTGFNIDVAGCYINVDEMAVYLRSLGASILTKNATSNTPLNCLSVVASGLVSAASVFTTHGDALLVETSSLHKTEAAYNYYDTRGRFLKAFNFTSSTGDLVKGLPPQALQYEFAHAASTYAVTCSGHKVMTGKILTEQVEKILSSQTTLVGNEDLPHIYSKNGEIVGFLGSFGKAPIVEKIADVSMVKPQKLVLTNDIYNKDELVEITLDELNCESLLKSIYEERTKLLQELLYIDYNAIVEDILAINKLINDNFSIFSSIKASEELLSGRAATQIKQVELILKFPLKTCYSAIDFGVLADFIDLEVQPNGETKVSKNPKLIKNIPYLPAAYEKQCGRYWCVRRSDPGVGFENDINIGLTYSVLINDLAGKAVGHDVMNYKKTDEQSRGSGKCKQVVIPDTWVETRYGMKFNKFLDKVIAILDTLLNGPVMKAMASSKLMVANMLDAIKELSSRKQPYIEKLVEIEEKQERIFFLNNVEKLIAYRYNYQKGLELRGEKYTEDDDSESVVAVSPMLAERIASIQAGIVMDDVYFEAEKFEDADKYLELLAKSKVEDKNEDSARIEEDEDFIEEIEKIQLAVPGSEDTVYTVYKKHVDELKKFNENYLRFVAEEKQRLKQCIDDVKIHWRDQELHEGRNIITFDDSTSYEFTVEAIDDSANNQVKRVVKYIYNEADEINPQCSDRLVIGNFTYTLDVLLKHYGIFSHLPYTSAIRNKISYSLTGATDTPDSTLVSRANELYGTSAASALSKYLFNGQLQPNLLASMVYAIVANLEETKARYAAFSEKTIYQFFSELGFNTSDIAAYASYLNLFAV